MGNKPTGILHMLDVRRSLNARQDDEMLYKINFQAKRIAELEAQMGDLIDEAQGYIDYGWDMHNESHRLQVEIDEATHLLNE